MASIPRKHLERTRYVRKLLLQVQTTVDGYMAGPHGEMDWVEPEWSADLDAYVDEIMSFVDCIVLGRRYAEGFIPTWAAKRENPNGESPEAIAWMNDTPKVVVSNTLTESPWENAVVLGGGLADSVRRLKQRPGGDLIVYGGSGLVSSLIGERLIDELHLFVNPTAIGSGLPVFPGPDARQRLRLLGARPFDCGITALHYRQPA